MQITMKNNEMPNGFVYYKACVKEIDGGIIDANFKKFDNKKECLKDAVHSTDEDYDDFTGLILCIRKFVVNDGTRHLEKVWENWYGKLVEIEL